MQDTPKNKKSKILSAFIWKFMERFGVRFGSFVLQLVLARILDPSHYGTLSMMVIFTTLANVFIQRGFNTALIQNKDVTEEDYSSVFWVTIGIAALLYVVLFFCAPFIADFYNMPDLVAPFRVLCLVLFPGAVNSIQLAKTSRKMSFKKVFLSSVIAIVVSGTVGITMALLGAGLWALVAQFILNTTVSCVVMWFSVNWRPKLVCNAARVKVLFSYGWKLLVSGLLDTLYQDLRSLVIGKKYNSAMLGYYNRGKNFPHFIITAINTTVQTVMLPAMSAEQNSPSRIKTMARHSICISSYIIFPMMAGLAGIATPLVRVLLTEKWLPCVPYLQIYCFTMAFMPVHSCNLQAINAIGRSDLFLKLEIIKKSYGLVSLAIATFCFDSPIAIALTGAITTLISCFVNIRPNEKLIKYTFFEQMRDIFPPFALSLTMCAAVLAVQLLGLPDMLTLVVQILVGVVLYIGLSALFKLSSFTLLLKTAKEVLAKRKKQPATESGEGEST